MLDNQTSLHLYLIGPTPVELETVPTVHEEGQSGGEEPIVELESLEEEVVGDETNAAIDDLLYTTNDNHLDVDQLINISIH